MNSAMMYCVFINDRTHGRDNLHQIMFYERANRTIAMLLNNRKEESVSDGSNFQFSKVPL